MDNGLSTAATSGLLSDPPSTASVSPDNSAVGSPSGTSAWWTMLAHAPRSVLMLDYDGTLSPFVRDRMQARMYSGVEERLFRLASTPRTRTVLVSGRPAGDFATLLPPELHLEVWGSHGRERILPDGRYTAIPLNAAQQQLLNRLEPELRRHGFASVMEKKIGSLAVHTRGLAEADADRFTEFVRDFYGALPARGTNPGLELLPFDGGIELRGTGCSKASAVETILREEPPRTPAAYLGDDQTDEDAFAALDARGAASGSLRVLVRPQPRPSAADLWLAPPEGLLAFLDHWLAAVAGAVDLEQQARR